MRILSVIVALVIIFSAVRSEAMNLSDFEIPLNIDLDKKRDLLDLQELSKKPEFRKMPKYVVFGLPVPEMVFEEAITFANQEDDLLSKFVLKYPYAPLVVMYWDTLKVYKNWGNKIYPSFEKFIESFTITILKKFDRTKDSDVCLEKVRDPKKEGVTLTIIDVLQFIDINKKNYADYDILDLERIVLWGIDYYRPTDFNIYDIIYDILYNNIARILTEAYKNGTIKKVLPIHQAWFAYKLKPEMWRTNGNYSPIAPHVDKRTDSLQILYPRTMAEADIRDFYVVKARPHASSGLGIGYDELYEFLVDNRPEEFKGVIYSYFWWGTQAVEFSELHTNNLKLEVTNIFYDCRFYKFDANRDVGNGRVYDYSLANNSRSSFNMLIYYRYAAIQCLNMLFFDAFAMNGGK